MSKSSLSASLILFSVLACAISSVEAHESDIAPASAVAEAPGDQPETGDSTPTPATEDPPHHPGDKPDKPDPDNGDDGPSPEPADKGFLGRLGASDEESEGAHAVFDHYIADAPLGKTFDLMEQFETTKNLIDRFSGNKIAMAGFGKFKEGYATRGFGTEYEDGVELGYKLEPGIDFAVGTTMAFLDGLVIASVLDTAGLTLPGATLYFGVGRSTLQQAMKDAAMATAIIGLQMADDAVEGVGDLIRDSVTKEQEDYQKMYEMSPTRMP